MWVVMAICSIIHFSATNKVFLNMESWFIIWPFVYICITKILIESTQSQPISLVFKKHFTIHKCLNTHNHTDDFYFLWGLWYSFLQIVALVASILSSLFSAINAYLCISALNATALDCLGKLIMLPTIITNHIVSLSYHSTARAVFWKHKVHKPACASNQYVKNSCYYTGAALWVASPNAH